MTARGHEEALQTVDFTNRDGDTVIARYRLTSNPYVANLASQEILLKLAHPFPNHNGGRLAFGPDGSSCLLYIRALSF